MKRYLIKLTWMLAFLLGLYFMVYGFSLKTPTKSSPCNDNSSYKCTEGKIQSGIDIKNLTHHILDFNR
jgi:hypothetical protein